MRASFHVASRRSSRALRSPAARLFAGLAVTVAVAFTGLTLSGAPASADVQDYRYDSWNVDYEIGVDEAGRAVAHVTETITADFPEHDQNRGIVRGIPDRYERARIDPRNFRVTNEKGAPVPFEIEHDDGFTAVLTGDDRFVHGDTTYVINYDLSDVILARDDGAANEFYWDIMDFEHAQPVDVFSATVTFEGGLAAQLTGDARCYAGAARSSDECVIDRGSGSSAQPASWLIAPGPLAPREGVTVAIGLGAGSVTQPATRLPNPALDTLPLIVAGVALVVGATAFAFAVRLRRLRRVARGTIIAQYDVPASFPPLLAAAIAGTTPHPVPAEFVHLAVNGAIRIEAGGEGPSKLTSEPRPTLRVVDPSRAADPLDQRTLAQIFTDPAPGASLKIPLHSTKFAGKMEKLQARGEAEARSRGYVERAHSPVGRVIGIVGIVLASAAMALGLTALVARESPLPLLAIVAGGIALAFSVLGTVSRRVLTRQGAEAREYLLGVREFIRVAEADRLDMLQSYGGAERQTVDGVAVVHLYERLLPYAMMFGLQKSWSKVLEVRYQQTAGYSPLWVVGPAVGIGAAGIAGIDSTISQFTSSFTSAVTYSSSSSGGATGGGFAGGGGGGGFSGGR